MKDIFDIKDTERIEKIENESIYIKRFSDYS